MPKADYGAEDKLSQGRRDPITWEFARTSMPPRPVDAIKRRALVSSLLDSISNNWRIIPRAAPRDNRRV